MKHKWLIASILIATELGLCAMMLVITNVGVANLQQAGVQVRFFQFDTYPAETDEEQSFIVANTANLVVTNSNGTITVQPGTENAVVVHMHKKVWGSSPSDAQAALAAYQPDLAQTGNNITVKSPADRERVVIFGFSRPAAIDMTISVPISTAITAQNFFGSITLSGTTGNVQARTSNGVIHVSNLSGDADLHSAFGSITAEHITGGAFTAGSNNGTLTLTDVNTGGIVTLNDSFGSILWNGGSATSAAIKSNNGTLTLNDLTVQGALDGTSSFGSLVLNRVQAASYNLHTNNGKIVVDGASGTLQARSDFGDVQVTHGSQVNLDLHSSNGSLAYSGSLGSGPHMLSTSFGSVRLTLPQDSRLTLELKTGFGQIQSGFPVTRSGVITNKHWSGTINGGGTSLTASSGNGNISLDILNP